MKQLFKIAFFAAVCVWATTAFSQVSFGVKAGFNLANVITNEEEVEPKFLPTFQIGGLVEFGVSDMLAVQTGISLQGKGYKLEETIDIPGVEPIEITSKVAPMYLQIPAHILYKGNGFFA